MKGKGIETSPSSYFSPHKTSLELKLIDRMTSLGYLPEFEAPDLGEPFFLQTRVIPKTLNTVGTGENRREEREKKIRVLSE